MKKTFFAALAAICLVSCNKQPSGSVVVSQSIGPEGGVAVLGGVTIEVPAGALDSPVELSAKILPSAAQSAPAMGLGKALELGPDGTVFNKPVKVTADLGLPADVKEAGVCWFNESTKKWQLVADASVSAGKATFEVEHFSIYLASGITMRDMDQFDFYAMRAVDNGFDDSTIPVKFVEYLTEDKYVMERYMPLGEWGRYGLPFYMEVSGGYVYKGRYNIPLDASYGTKKPGEHRTASTEGLTDESEFWKKKDEVLADSQSLFYKEVWLYYEMVTPTITMTAGSNIKKKGDSATVTVDMFVKDEFNDWKYPCEGQSLTLRCDAPDQVKISTDNLTMDSDGKATFKITALVDAPKATITAKYDYKDEYDQVSAEGTLAISNSNSWLMHAELECEWTVSSKAPLDGNGLSTKFGYTIDAAIDTTGIAASRTKMVTGKWSISNVKVLSTAEGHDEFQSKPNEYWAWYTDRSYYCDFVPKSFSSKDIYVVTGMPSEHMIYFLSVENLSIMELTLKEEMIWTNGSSVKDRDEQTTQISIRPGEMYFVPLVEGKHNVELFWDDESFLVRGGEFCAFSPAIIGTSTKGTVYEDPYTITLTGTVTMTPAGDVGK